MGLWGEGGGGGLVRGDGRGGDRERKERIKKMEFEANAVGADTCPFASMWSRLSSVLYYF